MASWRHIFLVTDLEGTAGIDSWDQIRGKGHRYEEAIRLATEEVNSVIQALLKNHEERPHMAPRISVWDGHGCGGLIVDRLDHRAAVYRHDDVRGFTGLLRELLSGSAPVDALAFIGQHAMEGSGGTLSHTYSSRRIRSYSLNGRAIGEFGLRALYAWDLANIPTIFISGDDIACREAQALVPGILCVPVKESMGLTAARHLDHRESCSRLASEAIKLFRLDVFAPALRPLIAPEPIYVFRKQFKWKFGIVPRPSLVFRGKNLATVLEKE